MQSLPPLDRLRKPEHTGANRCRPCTVVNVAIALALAGIVALLTVELAVFVLGLSLLAIYLRGYLVPYTPTLTTRYLPESVLLALGKEPTPESADAWDAVEELEEQRKNAVDVDDFLLDAEVVDRTGTDSDSSGYRLTEGFARRVDAQLDDVEPGAVGRDTVGTLFDTDVDRVTAKDREYPAYEVGIRVRKWPSEAALRADVAAHRALAERVDDWLAVPANQRMKILALLRICRTDCPVCGGPLSETNETVESCCVNVEKYAFSCEDCHTHIREYDDPTQLDGKGLTGV